MYYVTCGRALRLVLFTTLSAISSHLCGQSYILGRVLDDQEVPYAFAEASLRGKDYFTELTCTAQGVFRFENLKSGSYELVLVTPYGIRRKKIDLRGSIDITLHVARNIRMDEISVIATKAGHLEPVTHSNITASDIRRMDFGRDLPFLLEQTPSVVTTSDAGNGIGYSGLRIRGTDPTRINITLNGIPLNDAESHNMFWVDVPDIARSITNIQIQRGIGWSQPGVGDFGGSVNLNTLGFHAQPHLGITFGAGSFNTTRTTVTGGTGLLNGRFTLDQRLSFLRSDGYIDRAGTNLNAVSITAGYHQDATNIRFHFALGDELTYQAWNGVPGQYIDSAGLRTFNTAGMEKPGEPHDNEVDDYKQTHYQLHLDQAITPFARWTGALHYTQGKGFFEQYKARQTLSEYGVQTPSPAEADLIRRRWLDNDFYGFTSVLHFGRPEKRYLLLGGGWNKYDGNHYGIVHWIEGFQGDHSAPYYANDATKKDWNVFVRTNMKIAPRLDITVDLQNRWIRYRFAGPDGMGETTDQAVQHHFFNPKLGIRFVVNDKSSLYGLTGLNHKEPNRDDYVESTPQSRPEAEQLWDTELGYRYQGKAWNIHLAGYYMKYFDQLVPTGRLNDVGAYTRANVDKSYRLGTEFSLSFVPDSRFRFSTNATLSDNRIRQFEAYIDNWDTGTQTTVLHKNTHIAFSPSLSANMSLQYALLSGQKREFTLGLNGRYVGKQFLDNTSSPASALEAYVVTDLVMQLTFYTKPFEELTIGLYTNNLFDSSYESNGWIYRFISSGYDPRPDDPYTNLEAGSQYHQKGYFPQAGRNLMLQVSASF